MDNYDYFQNDLEQEVTQKVYEMFEDINMCMLCLNNLFNKFNYGCILGKDSFDKVNEDEVIDCIYQKY